MTTPIAAAAGGLLEHLRQRVDPRGQRGSHTAHPPINHRRRLLWVLAGFLVVFIVVISRMTELQVFNAEHYKAFGDSQRFRSQTLPVERGAIVDRNGVDLVMSRPAKSVFVDPALIEDAAAEARALAPVLGLDVDVVEQRMSSEGRFVYLARKVSLEVAAKVDDLDLPGVAFIDEAERFRPSGDLARSVLGSVDIDNVGLSGLEAQYGDRLTGTEGRILLEETPDGRTIAVGERQVTPAVPGDDVVLTLDRSMQYEVERILEDQVNATGSAGATAVVTRPATGEILAMANVVRDEESGEVIPGTNNAALTSVYEPGSVMKMVTISAAIEQGLVDPETMIDVPPKLHIADSDFQDAEAHGGLRWSVTQVFAHSSNIGTIKIAQQLGKNGLYDAIRSFGFGQPTGLGFPNEQSGVVPEPQDWWDTSMATIAIGQGVSVTPTQMLGAYNVIANGGVYVPPKLVLGTRDDEGNITASPEGEHRRVLSESTTDELNVMMRDVVTEGTGQLAAVDSYVPAGKTGTSRKPLPGGGYTDASGRTHYQSTFVGFVPAQHPEISIIVVMDDPSGEFYTGGAVAAPAFSKIASFALRQMEIPPPATDGIVGGTDTRSNSSHATPTTVSPGVTVNSDGRIRVLPAGEQAPPTTVPGEVSASAGSSTNTTRRSSSGARSPGTG